MTDDWPLTEVRLLDCALVELEVWTGWMVPPMDYPNLNAAAPYTLVIGDERIYLRPGPIDDVIWRALMDYDKRRSA